MAKEQEKAKRLSKRHRTILEAFKRLGSEATTRQIAKEAGLKVNGVARSLGVLTEFVEGYTNQGGDSLWGLYNYPNQHK